MSEPLLRPEPSALDPAGLPPSVPSSAARWLLPPCVGARCRARHRWARAGARVALAGSLLLPALRPPAAHAAPTFGAPQTNPLGLQVVGIFSTPTLADLDGDGDLDALSGERYGTLRYEQNGDVPLVPTFAAPATNPFGLQSADARSMPTLADLDGDGDLDALIGALQGVVRYQQNTGSAVAPTFAALQFNPFGLQDVGDYSAPTLADLDADGDLDALIGAQDGTLRYQSNTGTALAPAFAMPQTNPFGLQDVGLYSAPTLADLDADGDLDALIGAQDGTLRYQANTGTATAPAFAAPQTNPFGLADVGVLSAPTMADLDGDGDLDALIGESGGTLRYQPNTGTVLAPAFAAPQTNPFGLADVGNASAPTLADLDGDGDLDGIIGEDYGSLRYQENEATPLAVTLADFHAQQQGQHVLVTWETTSEIDNAGFNLLRGLTPAAPAEQLNETLIPSQAPGSGQGFVYQWLDETVEPGVTYFYWLDAVDVHGGTTRHGPVSAVVSPPTAVTVETLQVTEDLTGLGNLSGLAALRAALLGMVGMGAWARRRR